MLSPTVNVASLGAMIHGPAGHKPARAPPKGPGARPYFICGLILCASPRAREEPLVSSVARFVAGLGARRSRCEILQLDVCLYEFARQSQRERERERGPLTVRRHAIVRELE